MKRKKCTFWITGLAALFCMSPVGVSAAETTAEPAVTTTVTTTAAPQINTGDAGVAVAAAALLAGLVTVLTVSGKVKDDE